MVEKMTKHNSKKFAQAVAYYRKSLKGLNGFNVNVKIDLKNKEAYYALPALSNAVHESNADMSVKIIGKPKMQKVLEKFWDTFEEVKSEGKKGREEKKSKAAEKLNEFIQLVNKKTKNREFERIFKKPEVFIAAGKKCFLVDVKGKSFEMDFKNEYYRERMIPQLRKTCNKIIGQYAPKKSEVFGVSFELIPAMKNLDLPLQDYLDNFMIGRVFAEEALKKSKNIAFGSNTNRFSKLEPLERTSDLNSTILGLYYNRKVKDKFNRKFSEVLKAMKIKQIDLASSSFAIVGKGSGGKHFYGINIGYPDPKFKTKWDSPGRMRLKAWWNSQTRLDDREPSLRLAITETLPIENFVRTCDIDYNMIHNKSMFIKKVLEKGVKLYVKGSKTVAGYKTDFNIDLSDFRTGKYFLLIDDGAMKGFHDKIVLKKLNVKAGNFGNFPAGECFLTPNQINGRLVSEVVINVNQSYVIPKNNPIVVDFKDGHWKMVNAPKNIKKVMDKELKESKKLISMYKKKKTLSKEVVKEYERNFNRVGEFSINTNPKAGLSRYLIETEKIARMMHVALGSGFEPGRQTLYHWDTVINSPNQKMDVYIEDEKGNIHYIIKKGNLLFKK